MGTRRGGDASPGIRKEALKILGNKNHSEVIFSSRTILNRKSSQTATSLSQKTVWPSNDSGVYQNLTLLLQRDSASVVIPALFPTNYRLDETPAAAGSSNVNLNLTLENSGTEFWWDAIDEKGGHGPNCTIQSVEQVQGFTASSSMTITAIYAGIVYSIGRMMKSCCYDSSKRVIYEELPDQEYLQDLHAGIYIAREQSNLEMEYRLYQTLLDVYRTPATLVHLCGQSSATEPLITRPARE